MRKVLSLILALTLCLCLCACGRVTETGTNTVPEKKLDPNLQRLQGNWAAVTDPEEDYLDFSCPMPATWDENRRGYYIFTISDNQLSYTEFHYGNSRGDADAHEFVFEIKKITETAYNDNSIKFNVELFVEKGALGLADGNIRQTEIILYDNPDVQERSYMYIADMYFSSCAFVKLDSNQSSSLKQILAEVEHDIAMNKELDPYIGMPKEQLENSTWGTPNDINTYTSAYSTREQWCYYGGRYVYVENGYVTSIQK